MERGLIKISVGYIHYRATGQGKPIILLHPNQKSSTMFLDLMEVLGKERRVFAIDCPSSGMSDHIPGHPTFSDYAKWVTEVMDGLGVEKASFLGEAAGNFISIELANAYPERVEKLVLVSCPFWPDRPGVSSKEFNQMRHDILKTVQRPADATGFPLTRTLEFVLEKDPEHSPLHPTQSWIDIDNVAAIEAGRDRFQLLNAGDVWAADLPSHLEKIQCPVLLIWGDHFFYLQFQDEFTRRIKDHQVVVIKDARFHVAWEHPQEVGQAVLRFMA